MFEIADRDPEAEFFERLARDALRAALALLAPAARQVQHVGKGNIRSVVPTIDQ